MFVFSVWFQSEAQKQLEEIKALREKMKEVADEARGKEDIYKQLVMRVTTSLMLEVLTCSHFVSLMA